MILQPFLENAIWHGLSNKKENKKLGIKVEMRDSSHLWIQITDNGIGRKKSAEIKKNKVHKRQSLGIKLTEERLVTFSKYMEYSYKLEFVDLHENKEAKGTQINIQIPLK